MLVAKRLFRAKRTKLHGKYDNPLHYAEILRLKGSMLSLKGEIEGAERNYLASLAWACEQQAKSWDLRTSTSLARLWQAQGKRSEPTNCSRRSTTGSPKVLTRRI